MPFNPTMSPTAKSGEGDVENHREVGRSGGHRLSSSGSDSTYAKINAQGQWIERSQHVNLNELFERMSTDELERYARDGKLPGWFTETVPVPLATGQDDGEEG